MGKPIILFFFIVWVSVFAYAQKANLRVVVDQAISNKGTVKIGVFNSFHHFMTHTQPVYSSVELIDDSTASHTFTDIPFGRYAIAVYHDENNDDTLNTKSLHIPLEGVGFSGKFPSRIKPPDYPHASFRLKQDTTIIIHLIYAKKKKPRK